MTLRLTRRAFTVGTCAFLLPTLSAAAQSDPDGLRLTQITERSWQHKLKTNIDLRLRLNQPIDQLPDLSYDGLLQEVHFAKTVLSDLKAVNPKRLKHQDWLSYQILQWEAQQKVAEVDWFWHSFQVFPGFGKLSELSLVFEALPFAGQGDLDRYIGLLQQYDSVLQTVRFNLDQQQRRGIVLPKATLQSAINYLRFYTLAENHPLKVAPQRLHKLPQAVANRFQQRVLRIIDRRIRPACVQLLAFLSGDYARRAPETVGLMHYPGGERAYHALIQYHTSLDLSPQAIHQIGLDQTESIEQRLAELRRGFGFTGTATAFLQVIRQEKSLYLKTPEQLGERLLGYVHQIEPRVDAFFWRTPKTPYRVKRLDPTLEEGLTWGYYQDPSLQEPVGSYLYNGSDLEHKPAYDLASLIYHELIPGHHFQVALQRENAELPQWRRYFSISAYTEGWAEYASALAEEMGGYTEPYALYGRLLNDLFMAQRLVLDTGMNALGWTRNKAIAICKANSLLADSEISSETLRYAVGMPGQALAYKLGNLKIAQLREKAHTALGSRFDLRRFHNTVLENGEMPLPILEKQIDWFIAQTQKE